MRLLERAPAAVWRRQRRDERAQLPDREKKMHRYVVMTRGVTRRFVYLVLRPHAEGENESVYESSDEASSRAATNE